MSQTQEWWQGEPRYYAYEVSRPTRGSGLQKSLHSFPDAMSMDEWVSSGARKTLKRKENQSDIKRYPIGPAHSDKAALYQVFGSKVETKSVIRHSTAPARPPEPDPERQPVRAESAWVNVKIPKTTKGGRPALVEAKGADGNACYALELPDGLPPVPVLPFRTKRTEPKPADISGGTVLINKRAKRPIEERGSRGWRAGVIKCMQDSDSYEVGFYRKAVNGDPWRVVVQLKDEHDGRPRKVAIASEAFAACLHSYHDGAATRAMPSYRYPHPSQFEQLAMESPDVIRYLWRDEGGSNGRIEIEHRILDRIWIAKGFHPGSEASPIERVSTGATFEEAYSSDFRYLAAHMENIAISNPTDATKTYGNIEGLKAEIGTLRPPRPIDKAIDDTRASIPFDGARPVPTYNRASKPIAR